MPSKSLLKRGFKTGAERTSENYRSKLKISKFDPLDAFDLAKYLDVPIVGVDELREDLASNIFSTLRDLSKFSAMWLPNSDGDKIIIHNNYHSKKRQQSNLMHELAHIILGHSIPDDRAKLCLMLGLHYFNEEQEQEAKYLGGCLQITRPGLQWALKRNYSEDEMSDYFNASVDMVRFRLNTTGVLRQRAYYTK